MSVKQTTEQSKQLIFRIYFTLATLEGIGALMGLLALPRDPKNAWLLGFSRSRLLMLVAVLVGMALFGTVTWLLWRKMQWGERIVATIQKAIARNWVYIPVLLFSALAFIIGIYAYAFSVKFTDAQVLALLTRVLPIILWLAALGLQTLVLLPLLRFGSEAYKVGRQPLLAAGIAFGALVVLGAVIALTGWGLRPDRSGWDNIGVPLLPAQALMAWGVGMAVLLVGWLLQVLSARSARFGEILGRFHLFDWMLVIGIWLWAMFAWWGEPLTPTYFSPPLRAPNYEYYPFSDAALLDVNAENILIGEGYARIAEKPLYNVFLAGLHALVGHDYDDVVSAQIVVLALFPALVYLLGSAAQQRLGGAIAAVLLIFRERNAIALSGEIGVSHSKLLMTDFPAALGLALLTLVCLLWLRNWEKRRALALVTGGLLGLFLLLRSQAIVLVPVFLLAVVVLQYRNPKRLLESAGLLVLGVALAILPWMYRNYQQTGNFGYSQPLQALYLAKQYSFT
ncbi:MAG: glycosyltransferase family 39 protein, partial [Anaerolineales bacterium]|nr:glycosyltransferase family 39 protein [Anaerolineales bacterium]